MSRERTSKTKRNLKIFILVAIIFMVVVGFKAISIYQDVKHPNVDLKGESHVFINIPSGSTYSHVLEILFSKDLLIDQASFKWVADKKNYPNKVKAGKFKIKDKMSNNSLVNLLRSGRQTPVNLVFNKVRTKETLAGLIAGQIEADSTALLSLLNNEDKLAEYNRNKETAMTLCIPNTYQFFWNTSAEGFVERMYSESDKFWNKDRLDKASALGLSSNQVIIVASIVEEETTKQEEKGTIARVYLNRIKKGMRLQADPTVKFAIGDFTIRRILTKHLDYDSPYNTYKYAGLPPGPICTPAVSTIDAVLNCEKHSYLYFCAKEDFSGYHVFAKSLKQHNANAAKYRRALNKARIYK